MQPKKRFKTPKDFKKEIDKYLDYCKTEEVPITVTGFSLFTGINRSNIKQNYKDTGEFAEIYNYLMAHAENDLVNNTLIGKYNANIAKMLLAVNHGMKETVEIVATQNTFSINTSAAKLLGGGDEN